MDVLQFISQVKSGSNNVLHPVLIMIQAKEYPRSFFAWLIHQYKHVLGQNVQSLPLHTCGDGDTLARMHLPFLTGPVWYWLQHSESLDKNKRARIVQHLSRYTGPHHVIVHVDTSLDFSGISHTSSASLITIPDTVTRSHCTRLCDTFGLEVSTKDLMLRMLFARKTRITFDSLFFLVQCLQVVPSNQIDMFLSSSVDDSLVASNHLFGLSSALFQKSSHEFYRLWCRMQAQFPEQFWISYFSDQIWRAYYVIAAHNAGRLHEPYVKQISRRLPFSFLERDWRSFTVSDMESAHQLLYDIDFHLKNGGNPAHLESFFLIFFS